MRNFRRRYERMITMQSRFKSKVLWITVGSLVLSMLITLGMIDTAQSDQFNTVLTNVLNILGIVGILNNPTDSQGF